MPSDPDVDDRDGYRNVVSIRHLTRLIAREDYIKFIRRESLNTYIVNRCGKFMHHNIRLLEKLRKTKVRLLSTLAFMCRCRDLQVVRACL
jgi:hypothetical protein